MGIVGRIFAWIVVVFGAAISLSANPTTVLAKVKAELAWRVDDRAYLHYSVVSQKRTDEVSVEPRLGYVHAMSYEINEDGALRKLSAPWVQEEIPFQLGAYLPADKVREEDDWERNWTFDFVWSTEALNVNSTWVFTGHAEYAGVQCATITGTHSLNPGDNESVPRWTRFDLMTQTFFDESRGLVFGIKYALAGEKLVPAPVNPKRFPPESQSFNWAWEHRLSANRDTREIKAIKKDVEVAIYDGVQRLWAQRNANGYWPHGNHKRGGTALALLALLMCGEDPEDERIVESFRLLRETKTVNVYDVAVSIMAYEAIYVTKDEREAFLKGEEARPEANRELSKDDFNEVQRLTDWLIENRNEPNVLWNYKRNHNDKPARYDFSVTQYALLGLGSAMRCGVKVPPGYVGKFAREVIKRQMPDGPEINPVTDYEPGELKRGKRKSDRVTRSRRDVKARGWYYYGANWDPETQSTNAYGSMTCAGLTCLISAADIAANMDADARDEEFQSKMMYNEWQRDLNESMECGLAWLEHWFSITRNPNVGRHHYYYYLYGFERVCMLTDTRYLGVHDWFNEGASALLALQDNTGGWGGASDTCFALLFLKKGAIKLRKPVYTGPAD